jgi:hypothetical protein
MASNILLDKVTEDKAENAETTRWIRFGVATLLLIGIIVALFLPFCTNYKVEMIDGEGVVYDNETEITFKGTDVLISAFDVLFDKETENLFTKYLVNAQTWTAMSDFSRITLSRVLPVSLLLFLILFLADYIYLIVRIFKDKLKRGVNTFSVLQLVTALTVLLATLLLQILFGTVKTPSVGIIILAAVSVLTVVYQPIAGEYFPEKE